MKILHYFLGFPPYRSGGLTKFAYDLMCTQVNDNNEVLALWPGKINFIFNNNTKIKKRKNVNKIINFEIINPLPVPLDEGINNINEYIKPTNSNVYLEFLNSVKPDVIHIHTLMGLHKEFVDMANFLKIKVIFTTHDYFGICPKVILYHHGKVCDNDLQCEECIKCNLNALSTRKIKILQSSLYRNLKNSMLIKFLRKKHRNIFFDEKQPLFCESRKYIEERKKEYQGLREYYIDILEKVDVIHFNSTLSRDIYLKYIIPKSYRVISISHKNIKDNKKNVHIYSDKIRFTFLASTKPYKGFYLLKEVLDDLYKNCNYDFELNVYSSVIKKSKYINIYENGFNQNQLSQIFSNTDILVAPSLVYETFGYTVLEALSFGVPVIITNRVGAKDLVSNNFGIVINNISKEEFFRVLKSLTKEKINKMKENIIRNFKVKNISLLNDEIMKECYFSEEKSE